MKTPKLNLSIQAELHLVNHEKPHFRSSFLFTVLIVHQVSASTDGLWFLSPRRHDELGVSNLSTPYQTVTSSDPKLHTEYKQKTSHPARRVGRNPEACRSRVRPATPSVTPCHFREGKVRRKKAISQAPRQLLPLASPQATNHLPFRRHAAPTTQPLPTNILHSTVFPRF